MSKVSDPVRRVLFLYPVRDCSPYPQANSYVLKVDMDAERALNLILEACEEARRRLESLPRSRRSFFSLGLPIPPSKEEKARVEAHYANELCNSVFGEDPRRGLLVESQRMFVNYVIGEKMGSGPSARIVKISSLDKGVLEALTDAIGEFRRRYGHV
jgi:hypothetical protein